MDKSVLIHHNNTPLLESFSILIIFEMSGNDIDTYISDIIIKELKKNDFNIVYIKDSLSSNYLDFYGLRVAYHIRLSQELGVKRYVPIVILTDLDSYILNKIEPMAKILFTKNIFINENNQKTLDKFNSKKLQNLTDDEFKTNFLNLITVEEYGDNTNRHSIANNWAINQWASQLELSTWSTDKIGDKISSMLYFKYLTNKYNLKEKTSIHITKNNGKGKVLLIDDKWKDGWKDIMSSFCEQYYSDIEFSTLEEEIENKNIKKLEELALEKIKQFEPNIILLDIRLQKAENENSKDKKTILKISGMQLLKKIKTFNPSIQIIAFTASSNSLILDELHKEGILGYIKKDSPDDRYISPKSNLKKLDILIKSGLKKSYLKDIWNISSDLLKLPYINSQIELKNSVLFVFEILNSNIPKPLLYAMFSIYKSIEIINDLYIKENRQSICWIDSGKEISCFNSTENKFLEILEKKLLIKNDTIEKELRKIVCCRNYSMHPGKIKERCSEVHINELKAEHIVSWFGMLKKILIKIDEKD